MRLFDLQQRRCRFPPALSVPHQRRTRCGFSRGCGDAAGATATSSASFSRPSPTACSGNWKMELPRRPSPAAKPIAVPAARPRKSRLDSRLRQIKHRPADPRALPSLMSRAISRDGWLPIALAPMIATSNSATSVRPRSRHCAFRAGANPASGTMSGWMRHLLIHPSAHPSEPLPELARVTRYLEAVLLASSLSNSALKTCLAFPTCGTALAWSTLPGLPTTTSATIPMP